MWYIFLLLFDLSNAWDVTGIDCEFDSGFCGWKDSSKLKQFVYRDGKPMQFDNPFKDKSPRYFRTSSMALFRWRYRSKYFYKLENRNDAIIYPLKLRMCPLCFGVADLVSPAIHQSLAPRRFCYTFRITGSAFLTVSFITDYREPYLNQNVQKKHFTKAPYFSTSCIDIDAGTEVKIVLRAVYVPESSGYVLISRVKMTEGFSWDRCPDNASFECKSGECVHPSVICNLSPECVDSSDEVFCNESRLLSRCDSSQSKSTSEDNEVQDMLTKNLPSHSFQCIPSPCLSECNPICPQGCVCNGLAIVCETLNHSVDFTIYNSLTLKNINNSLEITSFLKFSNLVQLQIQNSTMEFLTVQNITTLEVVSLQNSKIDVVVIETSYELTKVEILECDILNCSMIGNYNFLTYFNSVGNVPKYWNAELINHLQFKVLNLSNPENITIMAVSTFNASYGDLINDFRIHAAIVEDLSNNQLQAFSLSMRIKYLHLANNNLSNVPRSRDAEMKIVLRYLDLSANRIVHLQNDSLSQLFDLCFLNLSSNNMMTIAKNSFYNLGKLLALDLSRNHLTYLSRAHFNGLSKLKKLCLSENNLAIVPDMFAFLHRLQYLQVDTFGLCCAKPIHGKTVSCKAPQNEISSCDNLIDVPILTVGIWYIALMAFFGNFFVSSYRLLTINKRTISSQIILTLNLSLADLLMGIYLFILAGANFQYIGTYGFNDHRWRHSATCSMAGTLSTLSSEASASFVLLITMDRVIAIKYPFSSWKFTPKKSALFCSVVWVVCLIFAVAPLSNGGYFYGYYSSSSICISLPLSIRRKPGWEYSMILFVGINFLIFLGILIGQIMILLEVLKSGQRVRSTVTRQREITLAKRLASIVITDMVCWVPIGVIGMMTFFGMDVNDDVYAWIIVIVLPVNSALNPILYTISALVSIGMDNRALDREMSVSLSMTSFHNRRKTVETQTDGEGQDNLDETKYQQEKK